MKEINLENMVNVFEGKMSMSKLHNEICRYMTHKHPERIVVEIDKNYYTKIYIPTDVKKQ